MPQQNQAQTVENTQQIESPNSTILGVDATLIAPIVLTVVLTSLFQVAIQYLIHLFTQKREQTKYIQSADQKFAEGVAMVILAEKIDKLATKEDLKFEVTRVDKIILLLEKIPFIGDSLNAK